MEVMVHFTGQLAQVAGRKSQTWVGSSEATLGDLVFALAAPEVAGPGVADLLLDSEKRPRTSLLVVLDGEQAAPGWSSRPLLGVKTVTLMTPIAGG